MASSPSKKARGAARKAAKEANDAALSRDIKAFRRDSAGAATARLARGAARKAAKEADDAARSAAIEESKKR